MVKGGLHWERESLHLVIAVLIRENGDLRKPFLVVL